MRVNLLTPISALLAIAGMTPITWSVANNALLALEQAPAPAASNDACPVSDGEGRFESMIRAAALDPLNPSLQHVVATFYFQKSRDSRLSATQKYECLEGTVTAEDHALAADPTFFDALVYKNIALRELAAGEADALARQKLVEEADDLRARAVALRGVQDTSPALRQNSSLALPPPPPPPPPVGATGDIQFVYAQTSFSTSGNARALEKVKDVRPVFPPIAIKFGIQGTVVIEAVVDRGGRVAEARIVESVPLLDQSAIDAVKQWQFDPATVSPSGDRVVLTVRASFSPPK
jgi:TonB family protein